MDRTLIAVPMTDAIKAEKHKAYAIVPFVLSEPAAKEAAAAAITEYLTGHEITPGILMPYEPETAVQDVEPGNEPAIEAIKPDYHRLVLFPVQYSDASSVLHYIAVKDLYAGKILEERTIPQLIDRANKEYGNILNSETCMDSVLNFIVNSLREEGVEAYRLNFGEIDIRYNVHDGAGN